jgi:hypothetical protein
MDKLSGGLDRDRPRVPCLLESKQGRVGGRPRLVLDRDQVRRLRNEGKKGDAPSSLDPYNGILFWQDRRNSTVKYQGPWVSTNPTPDNGTIAVDPITKIPYAPATAAQVAINLATADSPGWTIQAAPKGLGFNGVIYQPRGAWVSFQGGGQVAGSYQLITLHPVTAGPKRSSV